jgi:hypothetical protein
VNVDLSLPARVRTSLLDDTKELFAWRSGLSSGTTLLKLDIPNTALRQTRYTLLVTAIGPDGKTVTARVPIQIEPESTPASTGETEQSGAGPLGGSLYGDGDPPSANPGTTSQPAAEAPTGGETPSVPRSGDSPASGPGAAPRSPAAVVSAVDSLAGSSSKKTLGTVLLLGMLGLGSAAAGYKARSLLSFALRGIRAGSLLR